jgi:dsRNA-specific ribonuclease
MLEDVSAFFQHFFDQLLVFALHGENKRSRGGATCVQLEVRFELFICINFKQSHAHRPEYLRLIFLGNADADLFISRIFVQFHELQ